MVVVEKYLHQHFVKYSWKKNSLFRHNLLLIHVGSSRCCIQEHDNACTYDQCDMLCIQGIVDY
eukprot:371493-Ditylum_brightwellii.AAC.1